MHPVLEIRLKVVIFPTQFLWLTFTLRCACVNLIHNASYNFFIPPGNGSGNGCDLVHIQAPAFSCKAALSSSGAGQIRMERADKVKTVLCYLTELCQGSVRNPYPKMSTEDDFVIGEAS